MRRPRQQRVVGVSCHSFSASATDYCSTKEEDSETQDREAKQQKQFSRERETDEGGGRTVLGAVARDHCHGRCRIRILMKSFARFSTSSFMIQDTNHGRKSIPYPETCNRVDADKPYGTAAAPRSWDIVPVKSADRLNSYTSRGFTHCKSVLRFTFLAASCLKRARDCVVLIIDNNNRSQCPFFRRLRCSWRAR